MALRARGLVVGGVVLAVLTVLGALLGWWFFSTPQGIERSVAEQLVANERTGELRYVLRMNAVHDVEWLEGEQARAAYHQERAALLATPPERNGQITPYFTNDSSAEQYFPFGQASLPDGPPVAVAPGMSMWAIRFDQPEGGYVEAYWEGPPPQ